MKIPVLVLSWLLYKCLILLLSFNATVVSGQCLADQRELLLQLNNSLTVYADVTEKLVRWDQNSDCCLWDGVACDVAGRVIGLDLSGKSVSGRLDSSSLFYLKHLKSLNLSYNDFNSTIPARIGNLTNLTHLNLSNSGFGGQIPYEVSQLTRLVSLDISDLSLRRLSTLKLVNPNLSALVKSLSELEELYLDGVNITARGNEWGRALSSSLPRLRELSLSHCHLSGPIDASLLELRSLSVLRLNDNYLLSKVPKQFSSFSNLTSLYLSNCGLYGTFPSEIFLVATLEVIDIAYNPLLRGSLPEFHSNSSLQKLEMSKTNFYGSLPKSIGNLGDLSILSLFSCQFNGTLPKSIEKLRRLISVRLSSNKFGGQIPSFEMSTNLIEIVLSDNSFTGAIVSAHWENLKKLVVIDLRNNLLTGNIPPSLFGLPSLEQIHLSDNQFEGRLPEINHASSLPLETIDLSRNNLKGRIPVSIFGLKRLSFLDLSFNNFNGKLQMDHIQGHHEITTLDLSYNNLSVIEGDNVSVWSSYSKLSTLSLASCKLKSFPNLENNPNLEYLDLSNNQIHGEVPNWIWELSIYNLNLSCNSLVSIQEPYTISSSLIFLDLHMNHIHGNIPSLPIQEAAYIDLSNNIFNSSIPPNIVTIGFIAVFLSLSHNNLTGVVPESICNVTGIQFLDLSHNRLSGTIPYCIPAMMSQYFQVLNLHENQFTGPIPDSFPPICSLKTLNLNQNLIEGQIPNSLVNCAELEVLNLGNNKLSDEFPCMLKNISTLRVLDLRSNNFGGTIGCHHDATGAWKKLQIIDLAHNTFGGKIPAEWLSRWEAMKHNEADTVSESNPLRYEISFSNRYYQDSVIITSKGLELEFIKILTVFTAIDLSCNKFVGRIPEEVGLFSSLYVLNLSHNALTGQIPKSIGNLTQLESLDLSSNSLSGEIPSSLGNLLFLEFLNLSFNHLVGKIPSGNQMITFSEKSFLGNSGLFGFPLPGKGTSCCASAPTAGRSQSGDSEINWNIILPEIGFSIGFGCLAIPLVYSRRFRRWYYQSMDDFAFRNFPRVYQRFF